MYTRGIDVDREGRLAEPSSFYDSKIGGAGSMENDLFCSRQCPLFGMITWDYVGPDTSDVTSLAEHVRRLVELTSNFRTMLACE